MRTTALATLALAMVACTAEPIGHKWQVDKDGKPIPGTETPVWTQDEAVEVRQQALAFNVGYNFDCGDFRNPLAGETLLFDGTNYTAECNAIRVGNDTSPPQNMAIPFNDSIAHWASAKSWNDQVSSIKARQLGFVGGVGTVGMCIRLRQSTAGGDSPGWGSARFEMGPDGTFSRPNTAPFGDASFIVVKAIQPGGTCSI